MDHEYESIKLVLAVVGTIAAVSGSTAVAVRHHVDKAATEMARIQDKAATEIKLAAMEIAQAKAEVARIESEQKAAVQFWEAQVERYKQDIKIAHTEDYAPYQTAIWKKKRGGGPQKEEEKDYSLFIKLVLAVVGTIAAVSGSTAVAVRHHVENKAATEMARIQDKAATEMKLAATEIIQAEAEVSRSPSPPA